MFFVVFCESLNISAQELSDDNLKIELNKYLQFDSWPGKSNVVRDGINLSSIELTSLQNAKKISMGKYFFLFRLENGNIFIKHVTNWKIGENDFL